MMLTPIALDVFIDNDDTEALSLANKPVAMKQHDTETIEFYHIDALSDFKDENDKDRKYGGIHCNATYYISIYPPAKLKRLINDHLTKTMVLHTKN